VVVTSIGIVLRVRQVRVERDAAHLRELALRELADTDPLTGLYNRRSFLDKVMDSDEPKRLILLDVDHFKAVNDRYGHLVGDDVLVELSQALRRAVPPGAIIGRLGGEEFGIAVRADQTPTLPQALCRRIAETRFPRDLKITVSVGYALGQIVDDLSWKAIYSAADQALLSAKQAGRNRAKRTAIPVAA
jgi:diguanylate cyclase (GGDEF)-like protein